VEGVKRSAARWTKDEKAEERLVDFRQKSKEKEPRKLKAATGERKKPVRQLARGKKLQSGKSAISRSNGGKKFSPKSSLLSGKHNRQKISPLPI